MNHDELKHDITQRIDRLEDDLRAQLTGIESRLDELIPDVVESTTANKIRLEGVSGQIKLIWTFMLAAASGLATYLLNIRN